MSEQPAREGAKGHEDALRRAGEAMARAEDTSAYAENVLAHLYVIRDRLDSMRREAAKLADHLRTR